MPGLRKYATLIVVLGTYFLGVSVLIRKVAVTPREEFLLSGIAVGLGLWCVGWIWEMWKE